MCHDAYSEWGILSDYLASFTVSSIIIRLATVLILLLQDSDSFSPDPEVVAEMAREFVVSKRPWASGDFLAALSSRPERERMEIVDELFQRMEAQVRPDPTAHWQDFLVAHIMIQKNSS